MRYRLRKNETREELEERKKSDAEYVERMKKQREEIAAIVKTGQCPQCNSKIRRNLSLRGWWQCEQFGSPPFRKRPNDPPCSWQGFTD